MLHEFFQFLSNSKAFCWVFELSAVTVFHQMATNEINRKMPMHFWILSVENFSLECLIKKKTFYEQTQKKKYFIKCYRICVQSTDVSKKCAFFMKKTVRIANGHCIWDMMNEMVFRTSMYLPKASNIANSWNVWEERVWERKRE